MGNKNIYLFGIILLSSFFNVIYGIDSIYKCVIPQGEAYCQSLDGGLVCPNLPACIQFITLNFNVGPTDLISVLYEQNAVFDNHCGYEISIPTSIYISVAGSFPATINCQNANRFILFNTSFTEYSSWLNITVNSLTIINTYNDDAAYPDGGAISVVGYQSAQLTLNQVEMTTSYSSGNGGFVSSIYDITIVDSQFNTGTALKSGGAIYSPGAIVSHNSIYNSCESKASGGAIFGETVNFMTSKATGNYAEYNGGAVSCTSCYMFFSIVQSNNAGLIGGAVYSYSGMVQFGSMQFIQNQAGVCGGALHLINATGSVTTSNFTMNKANYGGALCLNYLPDQGSIDFLDSTFYNNIATEQGGALHISSSLKPNVIYHGIFFNNSYPTLSCDEESSFLCNNNCTISSCDRCGSSPCLEDYDRMLSACFDTVCHSDFEPQGTPHFISQAYASQPQNLYLLDDNNFKHTNHTRPKKSRFPRGGPFL
ncbi:putative transmembrane protein [Tieghemostelium lacteum]|uniref:Putative transmembrane protein n=1 Tax=Tieghemostelium lacteum TaxID=361077 RepID=A0A152AA19_TIELA|nr:putative transmembrane protein [Tieghemostelium lacteum]|eukprot:KYR03069.1 putative transmembrane protein [Tieghemostelium lacteum]